MLKAVSASKFVRKLIFSSSALVVLLPISTNSQPLPDSARFNQNTSVLKDFGLDSPADLQKIGNVLIPLPVLDHREPNFSPDRSKSSTFEINVPIGLCLGSYQERQEQRRQHESEGFAIYGPNSKCPGDP